MKIGNRKVVFLNLLKSASAFFTSDAGLVIPGNFHVEWNYEQKEGPEVGDEQLKQENG
jgi:carbonic anhydrase